MKVAEMVTVRKNSAVLNGADGLARVASLDEQIGSDDRAPAAAAGGIEEAADQTQRSDDPRPALGVAVHDAAVEQVQPEGAEIGEDDRLGGRCVDLGEDVSAEHPADHAGNDDPEKQPPVDIAVGDMADPGDRGGERLGGVDSGRRRRRRHAHADQQSARNLPERHAERAVDQLGGKADQDEGQEEGRIGEQRFENGALHP